VDFILQRGTSDQNRRVQAAISDNNSELSGWLKGLEAWAKEAFPIVRDKSTGRQKLDTEAMVKLNEVYEFAIRQHRQHKISSAEFDEVCKAGGLDGLQQFPRTPAQAMVAATRMAVLMRKLHPELAREIEVLTPTRSR
jgi:hypothetical protein